MLLFAMYAGVTQGRYKRLRITVAHSPNWPQGLHEALQARSGTGRVEPGQSLQYSLSGDT